MKKRFEYSEWSQTIKDELTGDRHFGNKQLCRLLNDIDGKYKSLIEDYHLLRIENAKLERKVDEFEKLMRKHNIASLEKLDALLSWERRL